MSIPAVHYVNFRGDEFARARAIFGGPVFIHARWDKRARRDIGPDDLVIFATGDETQPLARANADDIDERWLLPASPPVGLTPSLAAVPDNRWRVR